MAANLYIITIRWVDTPLTVESIQKIDSLLTPMGDWIRFSGMVWLLDTNHDAEEIYKTLASFLKENDSELVIRADPAEYSGWAAKWVDDWIRSKRNNG